MLKVTITKTGEIQNDKEIIGKIPGFYATDFVKSPFLMKTKRIRLYDNSVATLCYGGLLNGEFTETCHLECKWKNNCISYKKGNCRLNPEFSEKGFYIK